MSSDPFSILFVCTGNRCRSPVAEVITRALTAGLPVEVSSAGTLPTQSMPSPAETQRAAATLGYDLSGHSSRGLAEQDPASADLVIGFELGHIATAVVEYETEASRTWLLSQLVRTLEATPSGSSDDPLVRAGKLISAAHEMRGPRPTTLEDQIADPIGRPASIHEATARTIDDLCKRMAALLFTDSRNG